MSEDGAAKQDKPQDALAPLAKAIVGAAKQQAEGNADVSRAFVLGWHVAERFRHSAPAAAGQLGMSALDDADRQGILVKQIQVDVALLADTITKAKLGPPKIGALEDEQQVHLELLSTLTAADFRLGKAYGLGRALAETCDATTQDQLRELLASARVAKLLGWLDELSSALPPHAAGSISRSLERWRDATTRDVEVMARQGELWRALLSGEKRGTEMLDADSYLHVARGVAIKTRRLALSTLRHFPVLTAFVAVLLGLGIYLLAVHTRQSTIAGVASLVAGLGVSWKALGGAIGKLLASVEQPLWGSQLDRVIGDAVTMLPDTPDPWNRLAVAKAIRART